MEDKKKVLNRLSIIEGQIRGIKKMVEEEKDCKAIITQVSAVKSAIENTLALILTENLKQCLYDKINNNQNVDDAIQEAIEMLTKTM
ncbi:MAG: cytoplasmic protein [Haloplasmataceae bacterium]|jgi:DNA-binding FrmR family transcriptional regulator|nr:cytoplasmic protein [Haloplasmataceae bacterium]